MMRVSGEKNVTSNAVSLAAGAAANSQDNQEKGLLRKISDAQKSLKAVEEDQELSAEEKDKKKKEIQNQIQNLNSELQQYRVRKDQEKTETEEKQDDDEEEEEALSDDAVAKSSTGGRDMGVFVSLEAAKDRMTAIHKIRTDLEGRQRTAETEEEKEELQKKINNLSGRMGLEIRDLGETIGGYNAGDADSDKEKKKEKQKIGEIFGEDNKEKEKEDRQKGVGKAPDKIFRDIRIQV